MPLGRRSIPAPFLVNRCATFQRRLSHNATPKIASFRSHLATYNALLIWCLVLAGVGKEVRFDDRLATILALPDDSQTARTAKWRQLVDLLAQPQTNPDPAQLEQVLSYLRAHRSELDPNIRRSIAGSLTGRQVSPVLAQFFGEDDPAIGNALLTGVRLASEEWLALLPVLNVTARELLRRREDLPPDVVAALAASRAEDARPSGAGAAPPPSRPPPEQERTEGEGGEAQIRELVARIEEFRRRQHDRQPPPLPAGRLESFRWETGPDGVIVWVEGAPREALIGHGIAAVAGRGEYGADGQAAGAFEKRAPFRDARFSVAGSGPASGDWRISGVPFFHPRYGSFLGYRGTARRPRLDEVARTEVVRVASGGLFGTSLPAESLRNLIHELRTPLNAIVGFAEMIDGQYLGPAGANYRMRAREIIDQAEKLLIAVDDLDTAARLETRRLDLAEGSADAVALLSRLHVAYGAIARERQAEIDIAIAPDLPNIRVDPIAAERMFARLLAATIGLLHAGERVGANLSLAVAAGRDMLCLAIDRPEAIRNLPEEMLLDPSYSPEGDWPEAPVLGLGFALRLVRNLAEAVGGSLVIGDQRAYLYLPADVAELSSGNGS
jgi:signal transduction histidine kinase